MCDPVSIGMMIFSVVAAGASAIQQKNVAEAQMEAAADAAMIDQEALVEQMGQENDAVRLQQFERMRQGMREQSALAVSLGEANMTGNTALLELSNTLAQADYDMSIMESNREKSESQYNRNQQKVFAGANGRINTSQAGAGNAMTNGLQIAAAGVQGYQTGSQLSTSLSGMGTPKIKAGTYKVKK